MDYQSVKYDESARVTATGTCTSTEGPVAVSIRGTIGTDRNFRGTITGSVAGLSDTTALTGTVKQGWVQLAFSDLEPVTGVSYSGTVASQ
jgi:hypothetical protein